MTHSERLREPHAAPPVRKNKSTLTGAPLTEKQGVCPTCRVDDGYIRTRDAVWCVCQHSRLSVA